MRLCYYPLCGVPPVQCPPRRRVFSQASSSGPFSSPAAGSTPSRGVSDTAPSPGTATLAKFLALTTFSFENAPSKVSPNLCAKSRKAGTSSGRIPRCRHFFRRQARQAFLSPKTHSISSKIENVPALISQKFCRGHRKRSRCERARRKNMAQARQDQTPKCLLSAGAVQMRQPRLVGEGRTGMSEEEDEEQEGGV